MRTMRQWLVVTVAVIAALAQVSEVRSTPPDCDWRWVNPAPPRQDVHRVIANAGRLVAVGAGGTTLWSQDGVHWELTHSGVDADLFGVELGAGWFVAVGDGVVLRSGDGRQWTVVSRIDGARLLDVAFGAGRFVAVGSGLGGRVATSVSGDQWTLVPVPWFGDAGSIATVEDGLAVAVGGEIWSSPDGLEWSFEGAVPTSQIAAVAVAPAKALGSDLFSLERVDLAWTGERLLWAFGPELWSRDREGVWQLVLELQGCGTFEDWLAVAGGPGWAMASGISGCPTPYLDPLVSLHLSTDGGTSFSEPWQEEFGGFPALGRTGSRWVALGALGDAMLGLDPTSWQCTHGGCTSLACADEFVDLAVGDESLLAVGGVGPCGLGAKRLPNPTVATSPDGATWTIVPLSGDRFRGVAWTGDEFLAVGDGWMARSDTGSQWTTEPAPEGAGLRGVGAGGGWVVVAGRGGALYWSENGASWSTPHIYTPQDLGRVVWDGEQFLVLGTAGTILRSGGSGDWSKALTGTDVDLHGAAAGPDGLIAVGDGGLVLASPDGGVWTPRWSGFSGDLGDVAFADGRFVAVGSSQLPDGRRPAVALVSADGDQWTRFELPAEALRRVRWTGDAWIAVGGERSIVRAGCLRTLVEFDSQLLQVPLGGTAELEVRLSGVVAYDTVLTVTSSRPGLVVVPATAVVPASSDRVVVSVTGAGLTTDAVITVTLPDHIGAGSGSVLVRVQPPLWTPRRPSGRVAP
ncbi:MAG TPA: hypothetical protein VLB51_09870 [Methylomirabilota bacterium]|nr:hypothetical protein [Methylomirabilota bacterium]